LGFLGEVLYKELPDTSKGEVLREERGYERNGWGTDLPHALLLNMLFILLGNERCLVLKDVCETKPDENRRGYEITYDDPVVVRLGAVRRCSRIPRRSGRRVCQWWGE
jgi:hypothetical protein